MESTFTVTPEGRTAAPSLQDHVLRRLIEFSFASAQGPAYTFRDTFAGFAEAYFTLSLEGGDLARRPAFREEPVEAMAEVLEGAVESGQLAPLPFSTRLAAFMVLTSLASLGHRVRGDMLSPTEAADLLATMLFEGVQACPLPRPLM